MKCKENEDNRCIIKNDMINECIEKMIESNGIILATTTYVANLTSAMKTLIERAAIVSGSGHTKGKDPLFKRKVGAAVVAVRRGGSIHAFDSINHFFMVTQMIVPGSSYWNMGIGLASGDVSLMRKDFRPCKPSARTWRGC
jgi:multimeric flavodoxin WrbA